MRRLLVLALAVGVMCATFAVAQGNMSQSGGTSGKAAAAPLMKLKGTIKTEGDKTVFVSDKDQKSWDIMNPEAVKGHEGHHVELSAHVYADKNQIHVMGVKMIKAKEKSSM